MQETRVLSLCWEDVLEKGVAALSRILSWRIPWAEEPGGLQYPWVGKESDTIEAFYHALYTLDLSPVPSEDFLFLSHW